MVIPYSCAAWIATIHRGIDVARAAGLSHIAGATGKTSEAAVQRLYSLPAAALIDMGDFVGGMLKYVRRHPVARVTIAGGFAKMTKLGQDLLDLHSRSGVVDLDWLAQSLGEAGAPADLISTTRGANTALHALEQATRLKFPVGDVVARAAWRTASGAVAGSGMAIDVAIFDRTGGLLATCDGSGAQSPLPRNRRR